MLRSSYRMKCYDVWMLRTESRPWKRSWNSRRTSTLRSHKQIYLRWALLWKELQCLMHIFTHNVLEFTANISTSSKTIKDLQDFLYSNLMSFYRSFASLSAGMSRVWWKSTVAGSRILRVNCLKLWLNFVDNTKSSFAFTRRTLKRPTTPR